jgi:glutamate decarboxylase
LEGDTSADYNPGLPVVAFRFTDNFKKSHPHITQDTVGLVAGGKYNLLIH